MQFFSEMMAIESVSGQSASLACHLIYQHKLEIVSDILWQVETLSHQSNRTWPFCGAIVYQPAKKSVAPLLHANPSFTTNLSQDASILHAKSMSAAGLIY
jgi:hypothetical protein